MKICFPKKLYIWFKVLKEKNLKQDNWNAWHHLPSYLKLSWSSYFPQICFIYSSFIRIFPLLNPLVQKDQGIKLGFKGDFKNSGISYGRVCLEALNVSIFLVPLNEGDRQVVNLRTIFSQIKGNNFIYMFIEIYLILQELLCYLLKVF